MSSLNVDEVLDKLSTKFNKIFYDREFVCCVNQDFQVVLENKNSCCVVVFPVLGPNYLKAVRYQAKIFDLAVITLSTGRTRAIAVCQKEFIKKNSNEVEEPPKVQIMPQSSNESSNTKLRKKRPERQLYVPPAQRRLPLSTEVIPYNNDRFSNIRNAEVLNRKSENSKSSNKNVSKAHEKSHCKLRKRNSLEAKGIDKKSVQVELENKGTSRDIASGSETPICLHYLSSIHFYILWHYRVDVNYFLTQEPLFRFYNYNFYTQLPLYSSRSQLNTLYILRNNSLLWQPKLNVLATNDAVSSDTSRTYPSFNFEQPLLAQDYEFQQKAIVLIGYGNHLEATYESISKDFDYSEYKAFKILWSKSQCVSVDDVIVDLSVVNSGHSFIISDENGGDYFYECTEDHNIFTCYLDKKKDLHNRKDNCSKNDNNLPQNQNETWLLKSSVIVLEDRPILEKSSDKTTLTVKKNNNKNTSTNGNGTRSDLINNVTNNIKAPKESNEHDQEKEIMRKTKEHINRKSRPIMKYVDDTADTLKIGKNDNVNNWEELFDDDGQLQEELFKEVVQKVGTDVTILKAKEDYSDYVTKQSEELEHMVELYDFPPTLETHDIIQAFSAINSEAMYIKWVDDTHAILVLGSLKQAQRAVELDNPLIKARPMSVASGVSLATAYKHDLKPAMKRPPTNLQTARRLITTHLGTKSRISKEQNAKERNDLKAARELKKLTRKNEQDAWEGTLRSAIN